MLFFLFIIIYSAQKPQNFNKKKPKKTPLLENKNQHWMLDVASHFSCRQRRTDAGTNHHEEAAIPRNG